MCKFKLLNPFHLVLTVGLACPQVWARTESASLVKASDVDTRQIAPSPDSALRVELNQAQAALNHYDELLKSKEDQRVLLGALRDVQKALRPLHKRKLLKKALDPNQPLKSLAKNLKSFYEDQPTQVAGKFSKVATMLTVCRMVILAACNVQGLPLVLPTKPSDSPTAIEEPVGSAR